MEEEEAENSRMTESFTKALIENYESVIFGLSRLLRVLQLLQMPVTWSSLPSSDKSLFLGAGGFITWLPAAHATLPEH